MPANMQETTLIVPIAAEDQLLYNQLQKIVQNGVSYMATSDCNNWPEQCMIHGHIRLQQLLESIQKLRTWCGLLTVSGEDP